MKRILLSGFFLCFVVLPVSAFLFSLRAWTWHWALAPVSICLLESLPEQNGPVWESHTPWCSEVGHSHSFSQPGSCQGHSGLQNRCVKPAVTPCSTSVQPHRNLPRVCCS